MPIRLFTIPFCPRTWKFPDEDLEAFQRSHEILEVSDHWFTHEGLPVLALLVRYREREASSRGAGDPRAAVRTDPRADLNPEERRLYDAIRRWRSRRARRDGIPPFLLLTNAQVAAIARTRPATKEALRDLPGVGESRVERFGEEILALVRVPEGSDGG